MNHRKITDSAQKTVRKLKEEYLALNEEQKNTETRLSETKIHLGKLFSRLAVVNIESNLGAFEEAERSMKERQRNLVQMKNRLTSVEEKIKEALESSSLKNVALEKIGAQVEQAIVSSTEITVWRKALTDNELARNSYEEIGKEAEHKLTEFRNNKYFGYLLEAGYGSSDYRAGPIKKVAHRLAAMACDFPRNVKSYELLIALQKASAERYSNFSTYMASLEAAAQKTTQKMREKLGYYEVEDEAIQAEKTLNALKAQASSILSELKSASNNNDSAYKSVMKNIETNLLNMTPGELTALAESTDCAKDDALILQIGTLIEDIEVLKKNYVNQKEQSDKAKRVYELAHDAEKRIARAVRTSSDYSYRDFDVGALVTGYALGTITNNDITRTLDRAERYDPLPSYSSSSSSSDSGGFGGSSGGGFTSSSSIGGGGFSTSDSF